MERFAYGSVLEALSRGLYPDKRHVIREFVQNAYDGLYDLRKHHPKETLRPIEIKIQQPSIFIADYGFGMSEDRMKQYRYLGFSEKQREEQAGFRGIGKYSGLAIAEKIIVDSSPYGVAKRFQVVINVRAMIEKVTKDRNPPLDELLRDFTEMTESAEAKAAHFTVVELHKVRPDSTHLLRNSVLPDYLSRIAPVPLDPEFGYAAEIEERLRENVPDFFEVGLTINSKSVYKRFLENAKRPEYEVVLFEEDKPDILAYAWYCQNSGKGQFQPRDDSGLIYRVKNIAVGDRHLTRKTLWDNTPERAFHFFGEIHVVDYDVVPSADRTDFEDNAARTKLYEKCVRVASNLNRKAGEESATRKFNEALTKGNAFLREKSAELDNGKLLIELQDQVVFQLRKIQEDAQKRIRTSRDDSLKRRGRRFVSRSEDFLGRLKKDGVKLLFDLQKELQLNERMRSVYETVIDVLKDEFRHDPERFERVVRRIHAAMREQVKR